LLQSSDIPHQSAFNTWHHCPHIERSVLLLIDTAADRCYAQPVAPHIPMSEEQLKAFLEKVKGDTNLQEELNAAASPEAALQIANDAGFAITAEDIQSMQSTTEEVSDEELEGAAGGRCIRRSAVICHFSNPTKANVNC